jgi:transcriptional regulator
VLIHPWDAALDPAEWQAWLAATGRFGMLAVNNLDPAQAPLVVPTHFTIADGEVLIHLARPNPVWPHLEASAEVRLTVVGDYGHPDVLAGQGRRAGRGRRADQLLQHGAARVPTCRGG